VREQKLPDARIQGEAIDVIPGREDKHGGQVVGRVPGRNLLRPGPKGHVQGIRFVDVVGKGRHTRDRSDRRIRVRVARAIEGVEEDRELLLEASLWRERIRT